MDWRASILSLIVIGNGIVSAAATATARSGASILARSVVDLLFTHIAFVHFKHASIEVAHEAMSLSRPPNL